MMRNMSEQSLKRQMVFFPSIEDDETIVPHFGFRDLITRVYENPIGVMTPWTYLGLTTSVQKKKRHPDLELNKVVLVLGSNLPSKKNSMRTKQNPNSEQRKFHVETTIGRICRCHNGVCCHCHKRREELFDSELSAFDPSPIAELKLYIFGFFKFNQADACSTTPLHYTDHGLLVSLHGHPWFISYLYVAEIEWYPNLELGPFLGEDNIFSLFPPQPKRLHSLENLSSIAINQIHYQKSDIIEKQILAVEPVIPNAKQKKPFGCFDNSCEIVPPSFSQEYVRVEPDPNSCIIKCNPLPRERRNKKEVSNIQPRVRRNTLPRVRRSIQSREKLRKRSQSPSRTPYNQRFCPPPQMMTPQEPYESRIAMLPTSNHPSQFQSNEFPQEEPSIVIQEDMPHFSPHLCAIEESYPTEHLDLFSHPNGPQYRFTYPFEQQLQWSAFLESQFTSPTEYSGSANTEQDSVLDLERLFENEL